MRRNILHNIVLVESRLNVANPKGTKKKTNNNFFKNISKHKIYRFPSENLLKIDNNRNYYK